MVSTVIHTIMVGANADESRYIQRALKRHTPGKARWRCERTTNLDMALNKLQSGGYDLILLRLRANRATSKQHLQRLHKVAPQVPILGLVDIKEDKALATVGELIANHTASLAKSAFPALVYAQLLPAHNSKGEQGLQKLTPRERQILKLIAEGRSTKEVSDLLFISVKTGETHRTNLMRKLGIRSVSHLVRYAIRHGIIEA